MTATQEACTYWVCVDCYACHAGITEHERGEAYPPGMLSLIPAAAEVTAGLRAEEHAADCPVSPMLADGTRGDFDGSTECECEQVTFTWSSCDGCGSTLGGSREALTVWETAEFVLTDEPGKITKLTGPNSVHSALTRGKK